MTNRKESKWRFRCCQARFSVEKSRCAKRHTKGISSKFNAHLAFIHLTPTTNIPVLLYLVCALKVFREVVWAGVDWRRAAAQQRTSSRVHIAGYLSNLSDDVFFPLYELVQSTRLPQTNSKDVAAQQKPHGSCPTGQQSTMLCSHATAHKQWRRARQSRQVQGTVQLRPWCFEVPSPLPVFGVPQLNRSWTRPSAPRYNM